MRKTYDPTDWYWQVAGSATEVYSSARAAYVPATDAAYAQWLAAGGLLTAIDTDANLVAVLASAFPAGHLKAYAPAARYARETGGITVNAIPVDTTRESQAMIANAYALLQASGAASITYKAVSGFVTLSADQLKGLALAVGAHVQACFAAEGAVDAALAADPPTITTVAEIDAAFAAVSA